MEYRDGNGYKGNRDGNGGGKKPYGGKSYGDKPAYGKKPYGDKPYGDKPAYGKKPYGDKPNGDKPAYEKKPYGDKSYGDKPAYEKKPYGDKSYGDKPAYEKKPYGDKPAYGKKPYGDKSYGDKPAYGKKPYGDKSYGDKPAYEKKPYGDKSYGDKPAYEKKPYGDKPAYGKKPYGDKPAFEKKPYGDKPAYDRRDAYTREAAPEEVSQQTSVQGEEDEAPLLNIGRNAVREAVKSGRSIDRILVTKEQDGSLGEIVSLAKDRKLVMREVDRKKLDELCMPFGHGGKTANHQGIVAYASGIAYCEPEDILAAAKEKGEAPFVIILDGIMDPHNLGSIIRSADCAGAHGVIIGKRRSASVTTAVMKAAAGAAEHMKVARVVNIPSVIELLKKEGVWIAGADTTGKPMTECKLAGPMALVIGNEGEGLGKLVSEKCDFLVSIPIMGHVDSLNASVAAGILMFEKKRQDGIKD